MEFWATFGTNGNGACVFDFGNSTGTSGYDFVNFSPHTFANGQQLSLSTPLSTVNLSPPGILDDSAVHVVCILDPTNNYCAIYTNGVLENSMTTALPPLNGISSAWSYIGRSLSSSVAWLNATIDELRIYDGVLTPQQIALDDQYGPAVLATSVTLSQSNSVSGLTLSWPAWAVGFTPESAPDLTSGVWTPLTQTPSLAGNQWSLTIPTTDIATFYRLHR